jgi:integrase/recombinase XerD
MLREYYKTHKPLTYLFEGREVGTKHDERSLGEVLKQALIKVNIKKSVSLHW